MARRPVTASYRLQLRPSFTFDDAAAVAPYLADLGISHVYTSPFLAAAEGSEHGYDVVDPTRVREDLGGAAGFDRFVDALQANELGLIVDVVPHHMSIQGSDNRWWWEVLTFGQRAPTAPWFDIDWHSDDERSRSRIVLPVLGDHYGRSLEDGTIRLARRDDGAFVICAHELQLPVAPSSIAPFLRAVADALAHNRLAFLADVLRTTDVAGSSEALALLSEVERDDPRVTAEIDKAMVRVNGDADSLDAIVDAQHYRLARWTIAAYELDYRRFFDVNSLIALRSEREDVFAATHALLIGWARDGIVDGLRIDHIDGLRDPAAYLNRLRDAVGPDVLLLVEKILTGDEALPDWPVEGTTGYEALATIGRVLVDADGAESLRSAYVDFAERPDRYAAVAQEKRRLVLRSVLASDVERLTALLVQICAHRRQSRDFTRVELREALREVLTHAPTYRSYVAIRADGVERTLNDLNFVDLAIARAREARADLDGDLFDLLRAILLGELGLPEAVELALRVQQLSGPVVAKGDEDAAHYSWGPLLSANEVGSDPDHPSISPEDFHATMRRRAEHPSGGMVTTATHDTKRSEDVRARLAALSEVPDRWIGPVQQWWAMSAPWRDEAVDPATGWFIFETLAGAFPLPLERATDYVRKAIREAKDRTSWVASDDAYEAAVEEFVGLLTKDPELMAGMGELVADIDRAGRANSLTQVTLRLTLPGFPDTYQGTELWDDSLVDPDNRRPVDFALRRRMLDRARQTSAADAWRTERDSGLPKLVVLARLLHLRQRHADAFGLAGAYEALDVSDEHAVAYLRGDVIAVVVPRLTRTLDENARVSLPAGEWLDVIADTTVESDGSVSLSQLFAEFPVAVLER